MKSLAILIIYSAVSFCIFLSNNAYSTIQGKKYTGDYQGAKSFIQDIMKDIENINNAQVKEWKKRNMRIELLYQVIDTSIMTRYLSRRFQNMASQEQLNELFKLYKEYVVYYCNVLVTKYLGGEGNTIINVLELQQIASNRYVIDIEVKNMPISFFFKYDRFKRQYNIINISLNGISMVQTQLNSFYKTVVEDGMQKLIYNLRVDIANYKK